jgi:uncharacterized protein YyaL (SSP411 family)
VKSLAINLACIFILVAQSVHGSDFRFSPNPNKAHLIQWRHWGKEALEYAKKTDKLILLSLSAVWCHWCHVMDETTFSEPDIIAYINENFVPIRVDSDMRPDIDGLYNQGGWPSTVILLPEGEIIDGGNYIPPGEMMMRLSRAALLYSKDKKRLKNLIAEAKRFSSEDKQKEFSAPGEYDITKIKKLIVAGYDREHGGFGKSQKFPKHEAIDFLLSDYFTKKDPEVKKIITTTLDKISAGEIHDAVEGGFFRYATRPDWSAPHYEKMLDVNAGFIRNYASASQSFQKTAYNKVVGKTIGYVMQYLLDKDTGSFFGSQDADEDYFTRINRGGIKPPFVDTTVYSDSNSLMITSLVEAYTASGRREYLDLSKKAANFLMENLYSEKDGVFHYYLRGKKYLGGQLSDNVLFGLALIDLYNVTGEKKYIDTAFAIASLVISSFYDEESKQFRSSLDTAIVSPSITGALANVETSASNYRAVILISRLYYVYRNKELKSIVNDALPRLSTLHNNFIPSVALYGKALKWNLTGPIEIKIIANGKANIFLSQLTKVYIPEKSVEVLSLVRDARKIEQNGYAHEEAAYLCAGKQCSAPIRNPSELIDEMRTFLKSLNRKNK